MENRTVSKKWIKITLNVFFSQISQLKFHVDTSLATQIFNQKSQKVPVNVTLFIA